MISLEIEVEGDNFGEIWETTIFFMNSSTIYRMTVRGAFKMTVLDYREETDPYFEKDRMEHRQQPASHSSSP